MASWIVHLRIAENLLRPIRGLEAESFAIGNVAPDSGVPDDKWERFDPPPEITHFRIRTASSRRSADLEFYRRCLLPLRSQANDTARLSFLLGYFFHLVTDNLWIDDIYLPTRARFAAQFAADRRFIWEVKRDWYGLDLEYVRTHPESIFWRVFLGSRCKEDYLDFLPRSAIQQNLDYIKAFYQRRDDEMEKTYGQRPGLHLSIAEMDGFVTASGTRLLDIYRRLWKGGADPGNFVSALELSQGPR